MTEDQQKLIKQIIFHEGKRNKPYRDTVGKLTIGVGRNLDDRGITDQEVEVLLINDLVEVETQLDKNLSWWRGLSLVRQRVLMDMCFNLGIGGLLGFKNTLALVKAGRYAEASSNMLKSKWATQVRGRAIRLAKMMETGNEPTDIK